MSADRYRLHRTLSAVLEWAIGLSTWTLAAAVYLGIMGYFVGPRLWPLLHRFDRWISQTNLWEALLSIPVGFLVLAAFVGPGYLVFRLVAFNVAHLGRRLQTRLDTWYDRSL